MTSLPMRLRSAALLLAGALAVHELRFLAGYGHHADRAEAAQGHAYLNWLVPLVVVAVLAAGGELFLKAARREPVESRDRPWRVRSAWPVASASLLATYVVQETVEGWLAAGHPAGLAAAFGHGGWVAVPVAVVIGGLIALALRGAAAALDRPRRGWLVLTWGGPVSPALRPRAGWRPRVDVLARFLAGRGPPSTSV